MTTTQVAYWTLQEEMRKNRAQEAELNRSNLAKEGELNRSNLVRERETYRSNTAKERENYRSNLARETETNRSNVASEEISRRNLRETSRSNQERERLQDEANRNTLLNYQWQTDDRKANLQEAKRANVAREVETTRSNIARETETNRSNRAKESVDRQRADMEYKRTEDQVKTGKVTRGTQVAKTIGEVLEKGTGAVKNIVNIVRKLK